jgi:hypothetical protein
MGRGLVVERERRRCRTEVGSAVRVARRKLIGRASPRWRRADDLRRQGPRTRQRPYRRTAFQQSNRGRGNESGAHRARQQRNVGLRGDLLGPGAGGTQRGPPKNSNSRNILTLFVTILSVLAVRFLPTSAVRAAGPSPCRGPPGSPSGPRIPDAAPAEASSVLFRPRRPEGRMGRAGRDRPRLDR